MTSMMMPALVLPAPGRVSTGRDVPGQTGTGRPAVPLSRDKDILLVPLSLCPGTRAGVGVPGQTPLSPDDPGQNPFLISAKKSQTFFFVVVYFQEKNPIFFLWLLLSA